MACGRQAHTFVSPDTVTTIEEIPTLSDGENEEHAINEFDKKEHQEEECDDDDNVQLSLSNRLCNKAKEIFFKNEFLFWVVFAILLARAYPPLGAIYLQPQITATWIAVMYVFFMAGLGLKTEQFSKALQQIRFNILVQLFNFGVVSATVFGVTRLLVLISPDFQSLADGMVICSCLPITMNMVFVLTKSSGGDEAAAICNAAFGNMIGVFISPLLIIGYLGVSNDGSAISNNDGDDNGMDMIGIFYKLGIKVLLPIVVGQVIQRIFKQRVEDVLYKNKIRVKKSQEYALAYVVYTVFCRTFIHGNDPSSNDTISISVGDVFFMVLLQFLLLCGTMAFAWFAIFGTLYKDTPKLRVMALFGATHKSIATGIPLINAMFEESNNIALYTLPLLVWHPMQLIIGSFLAPRLASFVTREEQRLDEDRCDGHELIQNSKENKNECDNISKNKFDNDIEEADKTDATRVSHSNKNNIHQDYMVAKEESERYDKKAGNCVDEA